MPDPRQDPAPAATGGEVGSAREALAQRDFRIVFIASFLSNSGRWMQQVVLGIFAWDLTHSPAYLGQIVFAQLGPMLFLSLLGGSLADSVDRRKLLLATQAWQAGWSLVLAWQVADGAITPGTLLVLVAIIGVGQALYAPTFTAVLPSLVGRRNLSAAIALNSAQVNGSRVIGPAIGAWLASLLGVAAVFAINAASYLVVIAALLVVTIPPTTASKRGTIDRLLGGFRLARRAPQVGRPLALMVTFTFLCLPFIGQMPAVAELNLGVDPESGTYGVLYACFGLGALVGAASVGTFLLRVPKPAVVRASLAGFSLALGAFALLRHPWPAFPVVFFVGVFYFTMPTALNTFLQEHLGDEVRGRVMALWVLSFGGTVPLTNLLAGPLVEATSLTLVLLAGAISASVLAVVVRLPSGEVVGEDLLDRRVGAVSPRRARRRWRAPAHRPARHR
jgi:MFS family permease